MNENFSNVKYEKYKPVFIKPQVGKPLESVPGHIAIKCLETTKENSWKRSEEMTHHLSCKTLSKPWGPDRGGVTS